MRKAGTFFKTYFRKHSTTVARVACPQKFFFPTGADKMFFPGFLCMRPILCVRTDKILFFCCHLSRAYSPGHTPQVDNRACRQHDVTTPPPISISRQHRAYVTPICAVLVLTRGWVGAPNGRGPFRFSWGSRWFCRSMSVQDSESRRFEQTFG